MNPNLQPEKSPSAAKGEETNGDQLHRPVSPYLGWVSMILPGLGQILFHQYAKGLVLLVLAIIIAMLTGAYGYIILAVLAATDAYYVRQALNAGTRVGSWRFFPSTKEMRELKVTSCWQMPSDIVESPIKFRADAEKWLTITMGVYLTIAAMDYLLGNIIMAVVLTIAAIGVKLLKWKPIAIGLFALCTLGAIIELLMEGAASLWFIAAMQAAVTFKAIQACEKFRDKSLD